jgi:hypothetical protein
MRRHRIIVWALTFVRPAAFLGAMFLLGFALAGCGVAGSGTTTSDTRSVGSFSQIEVHGIIELSADQGGAPSLTISGDDNIVPLVTTTVIGNKLVIQTTGSIRPDLPLVARVTGVSLERAIVHGASKAHVENIDNDAFTLEIHGASSAELAGKTKKLVLEVRGAGSVDAKALAADAVTVDISGAGNADIAAPSELDARISGAGNVSYDGTPTLKQTISGAGKLHKR